MREEERNLGKKLQMLPSTHPSCYYLEFFLSKAVEVNSLTLLIFFHSSSFPVIVFSIYQCLIQIN